MKKQERYTAAFLSPRGIYTFLQNDTNFLPGFENIWTGTKRQAEKAIEVRKGMMPRAANWKHVVITEEEAKLIFAEAKLKNTSK